MDDQSLRDAGLKVTHPRIKILEILENAKQTHLRAEDIYRALLDTGEDVGLATVYRVLSQFETAGIVTRHRFDAENAVYELNQGMHHDHLVCVKCGHVEEFMDEFIEERQRKIAQETGFRMTDHALVIYGLCRQCNLG